MKKIATFLVILLLIFSLGALTGCDSTYELYFEDNFTMGYSKKHNDAFVGSYNWSGSPNEMDIVIPNTFKGAPVTEMGGYTGIGVPSAFELSYYGSEMITKFGFENIFGSCTTDLSSSTTEEVSNAIKNGLTQYSEILDTNINNYIVEDIVFHLFIGSNLQTIRKIAWSSFKNIIFDMSVETEIVTAYVFSFVVSVDEQNDYFYSDDLGRLYYKETGTLVNYFLYHNRDKFPEDSLFVE